MKNQGRHSQYYTDGNTVRKLAPEQAPRHIKATPNPKAELRQRKNRDRHRYMSFGYVLFLAAALVVSGFILTAYIGLQSDITNTVRNVARLERELNNLRLANEENYSILVNDVDLEHIRRVAIQELGKRYANEGQIVMFADNTSDYVRQLNALQ
jgi:hypothetical protein